MVSKRCDKEMIVFNDFLIRINVMQTSFMIKLFFVTLLSMICGQLWLTFINSTVYNISNLGSFLFAFVFTGLSLLFLCLIIMYINNRNASKKPKRSISYKDVNQKNISNSADFSLQKLNDLRSVMEKDN